MQEPVSADEGNPLREGASRGKSCLSESGNRRSWWDQSRRNRPAACTEGLPPEEPQPVDGCRTTVLSINSSPHYTIRRFPTFLRLNLDPTNSKGFGPHSKKPNHHFPPAAPPPERKINSMQRANIITKGIIDYYYYCPLVSEEHMRVHSHRESGIRAAFTISAIRLHLKRDRMG